MRRKNINPRIAPTIEGVLQKAHLNHTKNPKYPQHISCFIKQSFDGEGEKQARNNLFFYTKPPLPPYGAKLSQYLASGKIPKNSVYVFCGGEAAWEKCAHFHKQRFCLCLPAEKDPNQFRWPVVHCDLLVFIMDEMTIQSIEKIALCLLQAKADVVRISAPHKKFYVYRQKQGAAQ